MRKFALTNARVLAGNTIWPDHAVIVDGNAISAVVATDDVPDSIGQYDQGGRLLLPGFVDVQQNGGNGLLFNATPTADTIRQMGQAHREFGTTSFLPTLISDDLEIVAQAIDAVNQALAEGVPGVLGIHIEGPFLSTDRKGVHDPKKFKTLTRDHVKLLSSLKGGVTLLTIAPEQASTEIVAELRDLGIIVSIGHSNATYAQTRAILDAGATGFTHLFNAMSPLTAREPGVIGTALADQDSWCGLIVDGKHIAPASLAIAFACKSVDKLMLVTDAMPTVGMVDKHFELQGRAITVKDGVCVAEDGTLAGSDLNMATAVLNASKIHPEGLIAASAMASSSPAEFLGLGQTIGRIAPGYNADIVSVDDDMKVHESWIGGESIVDEPTVIAALS